MRICKCGKPNTTKHSPICWSCVHKNRWIRNKSLVLELAIKRCVEATAAIHNLIDKCGSLHEDLLDSLDILERQVENLVNRTQEELILGKRKNAA